MEILFEDNHLIAVNKECGELVQGDKTGDVPLFERVREYIRVKYDKPGEAFLGLVHRIDRPTSGIVWFSRTSKATRRMDALFKNHKIAKTYWAVVKHLPPKNSDRLINYLQKNQIKNRSNVYPDAKVGRKEAILNYQVIAHSNQYHLLQVSLETGRHHQIRAQLSHIGCPIKGDLKYGFPRPNDNASIHLHARETQFIHPISKNEIIIKAAPPKDVIWDYFVKVMEK